MRLGFIGATVIYLFMFYYFFLRELKTMCTLVHVCEFIFDGSVGLRGQKNTNEKWGSIIPFLVSNVISIDDAIGE